MCVVLICVCMRNDLRALLLLSGSEAPLLELHQLAPQGVLLSQDASNHGLGLVSGLVRLETREHS